VAKNLKWQPVGDETIMGEQLAQILRDKAEMLEEDGTAEIANDEEAVAYLTGLAHAGIPGAREMLDELTKFGRVRVMIAEPDEPEAAAPVDPAWGQSL
jgi:hypothetical protein